MRYRMCMLLGIVALLWPCHCVGTTTGLRAIRELDSRERPKVGVTFVEDVVGWGGLTEPNRYAAAFDGQAGNVRGFGTGEASHFQRLHGGSVREARRAIRLRGDRCGLE